MQPGRPTAPSSEPLGVTLTPGGVNVAVFSRHATRIEFCIFRGDDETRFELTQRLGDVWFDHIAGVNEGARYGLRAYGPYEPARGHRFNPHKLLLDPYARALDGDLKLHESMYGYDRAHLDGDLSFSTINSAPYVAKCIVTKIPDTESLLPRVPWGETVLYEAHIKGLTKLNSRVAEPLRGRISALSSPEIISYFQSLGVNCLELMPASASLDERHLGPLGLTNYWGYNHIAFMAPSPRYASGWDEVKLAVSKLYDSGIETLIDVVYNHTGEGDALGPTLCFRGLDNASYYRLLPDNPRFYIDDMGCGNCLALDRPWNVRLVMESLRAWAQWGGVQGFRFDLAPALGRRADGFDAQAPLIAAIEQDPVLRNLKIIAEPWDIGMGGYQLGQFPAVWGEWNDKYRDTMRDFWCEAGTLSEFATRLCGSSDFFLQKRPSRSVNFITAHDGFTLADLVSYETKHNEANGEQNRDGTDQNRSWNHGVEGSTADPRILEARLRDQRNLLATLMFSRGTPMLSQGAEFGQSQGGNNNAYAQDNQISWVNWEKADQALLSFTRRLILLRKDLSAFFADEFVREGDVAWLSLNASPLQDDQWHDQQQSGLVMVITQASRQIALVFNRSFTVQDLNLPVANHGHWQLHFSTQAIDGVDVDRFVPATVPLRCVMLFTSF